MCSKTSMTIGCTRGNACRGASMPHLRPHHGNARRGAHRFQRSNAGSVSLMSQRPSIGTSRRAPSPRPERAAAPWPACLCRRRKAASRVYAASRAEQGGQRSRWLGYPVDPKGLALFNCKYIWVAPTGIYTRIFILGNGSLGRPRKSCIPTLYA